ncbi:myb-like transcription factor family protein [Striga asiatica]|uniref:Myb-like transcription factor family protein n=1 Tax=Striga asiatica TaxID=4170 RepID=A0A5A7RIV5_STRAF|nr:myb-like transcription factor family protein [Striga asiatica]
MTTNTINPQIFPIGGWGPRRHVHGVTAKYPKERGELLHLRQRVLRPRLRQRGLEINIKHVLEVLGRPHVCVVHKPYRPVAVGPRLYLGQADVAEGERRQHFEEDAGPLPLVREHDARLERPVRPRHDRLPGQHHKPGHVPRVILDPVPKHLQPVQLRRTRRRDRRRVPEPVRRDVLRRPRGVVNRLTRHRQSHLGQGVLALGKGLRVAYHAGEVLAPDAREGEEAVVDGELDLADDVEAVAEEEVVVAVDRAAQRVLHREDGPICDPELHRLEGHLELVAGDGLAAGVGTAGGGLAVRAGDALVGHAEAGPVHRRRGEVGDAERPGQERRGGGGLAGWSGDEVEDGAAVYGGDGIGSAAAMVGSLLLGDDLAGEYGARALPLVAGPADGGAGNGVVARGSLDGPAAGPAEGVGRRVSGYGIEICGGGRR